MKIRNGFVSNSSSSSFIVGVAKIDDYNIFQKYLESNNIKLNYDFKVLSYNDILEKKYYFSRIFNNKLIVESFQTDVELSTNDINDNDLICIVNIINNEGDGDFINDDYDLDYDIDLSFFEKSQQKIYNMFFDKSSGLNLKLSQATYGAGRNG